MVADVIDVKIPDVITEEDIANDAVTDPICAVPATRAGRVASETGCVA
jgi:hypothetical protein